MGPSYRFTAMAVNGPMKILGFMTGTSLDAVDMAVLETDGVEISAFGPAGERKLREATRDLLLKTTDIARAWPRGEPEPVIFEEARRAVADEHFQAAESFLDEHGLSWSDFDLLGVHGQTVLHERPTAQRVGRTVQLLDADRLARLCGRPVAFDFRTADVAVGGEGAGGVANITLIGANGDLLAFDTGPGNGMIDLMLQARGLGRFDEDGRLALAGRVDEAVLAALLDSPYFDAPAPKSLDRYDFSLTPVDHLSAEDAAATLVAFTAEAVFKAFAQSGEAPSALIVCGGGRHNPAIMQTLAARAPVPVKSAEAYGWRGDSIEAEAFAYLAARTAKGLPISFPGTTGVPAPMTGGRIVGLISA